MMRWKLLIVLLFITACSGGEGDNTLNLFGAKPTQLDSTSAESVATTFLDAWQDRDYQTMYSLITPNARDAFTETEFLDTYTFANDTLGLKDISWEISAGPLVQGTTASLEYTVTFETSRFDTFTDPDPNLDGSVPRTMWLTVVPNEGWRVAWSRMDIFAGWTNDANLRVYRVMPRRGNIYDRNGKVLVDSNGTVIGIYVRQDRMRNQAECMNQLSRIFRLEYSDIEAIFSQFLPGTEFLAGEVSPDTIRVEDGVLAGTCNYTARERSTRRYFDRVASHLVGYVGQIPADRQAEYRLQNYPDDALVGRDGLELAFETELRGTIGVSLRIETNTGVPIRTVATRQPQPGQDLYLTIDRDLQLDLQGLVADAYDNGQLTWAPTSKGGAVIVMNVNTGEVLAMVSYPDYDPSVFNPDTPILFPAQQIQTYRDDPRTPLLNRATKGSYPLGSVFKVFSMVAGLDSGVWSASNTVNCTGRWDGTPYNDRVRTDWLLPPGHGLLDMKGGLINSCNPYFWTMGVTLNAADPEILPGYAERMGFGSVVPFQGLATDSGFIQDPEWKRQQGEQWSNSDAANLVIGQGQVTVNPLQVVRATAMVANGGILYDPMIVQRVGLVGEDPTYTAEPRGTDLGINPDVLTLVREAMCDVTLTYDGTANYIYQEWYEHYNYQVIVCGKTGTAESGQAKPHAWFAAFAPQDTPEIAVVSLIENSCEGSEVSAPIVRRVMEIYYGLPQDFGWPPLWESGCTTIGPDATYG
ncbi:MAG: hypothetical protein H6673_08115 [Anaerolineales bacterium]|nr:hypothetical protein [Anaerolineales bacterium]